MDTMDTMDTTVARRERASGRVSSVGSEDGICGDTGQAPARPTLLCTLSSPRLPAHQCGPMTLHSKGPDKYNYSPEDTARGQLAGERGVSNTHSTHGWLRHSAPLMTKAHFLCLCVSRVWGRSGLSSLCGERGEARPGEAERATLRS